MKNASHNGFTLIELVVVIVILGILTVTALPKFIDLEKDAKISVLKNVAGSIETAANHAFLKARIHGVEADPKSSPSTNPIEADQGIFELKYGYPEAFADNSNGVDIIDLMDISEELEICYSTSCISGNSSHVKVGYDTTHNTGCYVRYIEPEGTDNSGNLAYKIEVVEQGC